MTLVNTIGDLVIGPALAWPFGATAGSDVGGVADAANEGVAMIFIAKDSVTIDALSFRLTAVTTSVVMVCSIEALDASGNPDGTPIGSSVNSASLTAAGVYEVSGLGAAVTRGTAYAACVRYSSGTSGTILYAQGASNTAGLPHISYNVGAGWVKSPQGTFGAPFGIGTSTSAYLSWPGCNGPYTIDDLTYASASSPDEYGLRFQVTTPMRIWGFIAAVAKIAGGTFSAVLTDASGNDVGSTFTGNIDSDLFGSGATEGLTSIPFAASFTLLANTTYVIGIKATSTGNLSLRRATMLNNSHLGSWFSKEWYLASRKTVTAWTLTATEQCPFIWLLCDQVHDGAGGGGLRIVSPGGLG